MLDDPPSKNSRNAVCGPRDPSFLALDWKEAISGVKWRRRLALFSHSHVGLPPRIASAGQCGVSRRPLGSITLFPSWPAMAASDFHRTQNALASHCS